MPVRGSGLLPLTHDDGTNSAWWNGAYSSERERILGLGDRHNLIFAVNQQLDDTDGEVFLKNVNGVQLSTTYGLVMEWDGIIEWATGTESFNGGTENVPEMRIYKNGVLAWFGSPMWQENRVVLFTPIEFDAGDEIAVAIGPNTGGPGSYQVQAPTAVLGVTQRYS